MKKKFFKVTFWTTDPEKPTKVMEFKDRTLTKENIEEYFKELTKGTENNFKVEEL